MLLLRFKCVLRDFSPCKVAVRGYFSGDNIVASQISGWDYLKNPRLNKGLAFTIEERQKLGLHGMFPSGYLTQDEQMELYLVYLDRYKNPLNKYMYLNELRERNERIFFRILTENVELTMPIVYTPTVGLACQAFGMLYRLGSGLYISKYDKGHIRKVIANWPEPHIRGVCMTDGERILGLGDLGAFGMGIPVGKLALYTAVAGIKPHTLLPITLDVGTNNETLRNDITYIGIREPRITGVEYVSFIDEVMEALTDRFGCNCLIQFEDFSNINAFNFMHRYKKKFCTFNDDVQGTAAAVLAGLLVAEKICKKPLEHHEAVLFFGAGGCNLGIAELMQKKSLLAGIPEAESAKRFWFMDVDGLITKSRQNLDEHRAPFAKDHAPTKDLEALVKEIKPSILIGASTKGGTFTPAILKQMAQNADRPIIFALSNPTDNAECTAAEAYKHTDGRVIYASGSPMDPVVYNGKTYHTGQGNNAYVFPGIALAVMATKIHFVVPEFFLIAAQTIADMVTPAMMDEGRTYPPLSTLQTVSLDIATRICDYAYCRGLAMHQPRPKDIRAYLQSTLYVTTYEDEVIHETWKWPQDHKKKLRFDKDYILRLGSKKPKTK